MDPQSGRESLDAERFLSRRAVVRGGIGLAAAALGPAFAADAGAQVTTEAALPTSASTLSGDDYIGMFVEVLNGPLDVDASGVGSCGFVESGDAIDGYDVRLIDETNRDRTAEARLYATAGNEEIRPGQTFVVNQQEPCSDEFVTVHLEQREAAGQVTGDDEDDSAGGAGGGGGGDVATPGPAAGETATPGVDTGGEPSPGEVEGTPTPNGTAGTADGTPAGGTTVAGEDGGAGGGGDGAQTTAANPATGTETPGFGALAALTGLAAAAAAAVGRARSEE